MNRAKWLVVTATLFAALLPVIAQSDATATPRKPAVQGTHEQKAEGAGRGEQVFKQNCSRCHAAPQGFPAQISRSVVRHMRVRASLSSEDEKALLKFMNP